MLCNLPACFLRPQQNSDAHFKGLRFLPFMFVICSCTFRPRCNLLRDFLRRCVFCFRMVRCRFGRICNLKSEISAAQNSRRAFWDLRRAFLGFVKARMAGFEAVCNLILGFCNHPQMTKPKQISACKPRTIFGMVSARFCHLLRRFVICQIDAAEI